MDASKITLASYIVYLQGIYKRYGNISIAQLKYIECNRKKGGYVMSNIYKEDFVDEDTGEVIQMELDLDKLHKHHKKNE